MEYWPDTLGYRIDFFTIFSLLGVAQGFFLVLFFLGGKNSTNLVNRYIGLVLLVISLVVFEIFLCYSGAIIHFPHYVDFSEPFNFLFAPFIYLAITGLVDKHPKNWYWHLLPFVIYSLNHLFFLGQSETFKLNAFRHSYHPDLPELPNKQFFTEDLLGIKQYVNELSIMQMIFYVYPAYQYLSDFFKTKNYPHFWTVLRIKEYRWFFVFLYLQILSYGLWIFKVLFIFRDSWDNISAALQTLTIYAVNFFVIKDAIFQQSKSGDKKYQKSALSKTQGKAILQKLVQEMRNNQPYLNPKLTLKMLAEQINISPHHLSQVLNEQLNKTYYEWIAEYRVSAAKDLLVSPKYQHYKLVEIGTLAGFNSRSVFYKAFKKLEGCSPSAFKNAHH